MSKNYAVTIVPNLYGESRRTFLAGSCWYLKFEEFSLRFSAYLCVLCVKGSLNTENAEIRREPQRRFSNSDITHYSETPWSAGRASFRCLRLLPQAVYALPKLACR